MRVHVGEERPRVFLCFAGADHAKAERLRAGLRSHGVATVGHEYQIGPGENIVLEAERALSQSDYFVLLWSRATVNQPWIGENWSAALVRGMREKRRFLFVLRLDDTPLPMVLAARPHLDAFENWHAAVAELAATWSRERAMEYDVLPVPAPGEWNGDPGPRIVLYVRNQDLGVYHKLEDVPQGSTGRELYARIRAELELPGQVSMLQGSVGMRFSYRIMKNGGVPLDGDPLSDKPLSALGLCHGDFVDLEIEVEPFGPDNSTAWVYLGDDEEPELSPVHLRALADAAFGHLKPWE
ncbi:toll/interleukin-1 receptor domain-containing protein [Streptomyces sp. ODS28]|uniref:toll/interleukin-1 receptor domain-containing protein n=1 Tax=Streptomyces sp. ODS28 TaxID=3136688 RepID=UPI0031EDAF69